MAPLIVWRPFFLFVLAAIFVLVTMLLTIYVEEHGGAVADSLHGNCACEFSWVFWEALRDDESAQAGTVCEFIVGRILDLHFVSVPLDLEK